MTKKLILLVTILTLVILVAYLQYFNDEKIEDTIMTSDSYKTVFTKVDDVINFSINTKDYSIDNGKDIDIRKLIYEKYDCKVYLDKILNQEEKLWIHITFENDWNYKQGKGLTFKNIYYKNGEKICGFDSSELKVTDSKGDKIHASYGGGGSTYYYGFHIEKEDFQNNYILNVKLKGFNLVTYELKK
ncbi:hypothetical protein [Tepidibacter hydrothermalis]|uniref:Lipoprotein n=1 Tax=Tepidibacter hydrothermalis TaxID=3036126 RepID=A0ABY8E778_9FIRM|nr:hypothetical protein [Tepidibacter hydrothermalis]WFD08701.1 hypothetical protein P4S50_09840 [Tepidibacter hydrothermalis]